MNRRYRSAVMDLVLPALILFLGLGVLVECKTVEPFRRDVGHPQWHHGTFQDVSENIKREAHHLLHSRARVPFHVPLEINVVLVGFSGDGGYRYNMRAAELGDFMKRTFPTHKPACLESGLPLDIEHDLYYNVIPVGVPELISLEMEIKRNMVLAGTARENEWGREIPRYEVEATVVENSMLDPLYTYLFGYEASKHSSAELNKPVPNAIFVLNFDKVRMDPRIEDNATTFHEALSDQIQDLTQEELAQQDGGYTYHYTYNGGAATQVWLGAGRYAVIDLSAGPCVYGKIESDEGSVGYRSIPRLQHLLFPRRRDPVSKKDTEDSLRGLLSSLIVSAIEHVISPDVRFEYVDPAMRLLIPVIVMRNHHHYNPLQPGSNFSIHMGEIEEEVRKMVPPGQEVLVVGGVHNLHDHEKLSIAVVRALRSYSVHETRKDGRFHARTRTYLDGPLLREELRHSTDVLAAGLLDVADPSSSSKYFRNEQSRAWGAAVDNTTEESVIQSTPARWGTQFLTKDREAKKKGSPKKRKGGFSVEKSYGTRVIPVFVLSLSGVDPELLMEGESLMWSSHDSVFVLQHGNDSVPLSYGSDTARRHANANSPQRHIIAGLASVVGGIAAPYERASHIHGRPMHNWLWASGHHPFGPFSNTSTISQLLVDTSLRNTIYSRVDMALRKIRDANEKIQAFTSEYLQTPLGEKVKDQPKKPKVELWLDMFYKKTTPLPQPVPQNAVNRLESYLDGLEDQLVNLASHLYDHRLQDAFKNSTNVVRSSMFVQDYVDHVLWREKENMRCCHVEYNSPQASSQTFVYGGILLAGFLVYFLVIFLSPAR
ncbi:hypothetical protein R1flu_014590 [Riccia fluitans]|uniref:DUF7906 domain-containing protein n=1 Tax=Riccia fluitans TaxID=41844 RepID=A0ABD1YJW5_9MARC